MKRAYAELSQEQLVLAEQFWQKVGHYLTSQEIEKVHSAYDFAYHSHAGQFRKSGHQYFYHLLSVADILADLHATPEILMAALLHDVVEDTAVEIEEVTERFGDLVGYIVESATKLLNLENKTQGQKKLDNLRRMIKLMERHPEGLLVKLADRLHNVRTLHYFTSSIKRKRIAKETLEIYAPLAERLGVEIIKLELEEICFKELFPDEFARISAYLDERRELYNSFRMTMKQRVTNCAKNADFSGIRIYEREKKAYSVWEKMRRKHYTLEQVRDIYSLRVVLPTTQDCYTFLNLLSEKLGAPTNAHKDYIASPKENGYQSLHTTLWSEDRSARVEIQIRSAEMHHNAEYGIAAHWLYKGNASQTQKAILKNHKSNQKWLQFLLQPPVPITLAADEGSSPSQKEIMCLTSKGDSVLLPEGATVLDFAYAVSEDIGNRCVGAKVNGVWHGKEARLNYIDQVEVITSSLQRHRMGLLNAVQTLKAHECIRKMNVEYQKKQRINEGKILLAQYFCALSGVTGGVEEELLRPDVLKDLNYKSVDDLYSDLASGNIQLTDILSVKDSHNIINPELKDAYLNFIKAETLFNVPVESRNQKHRVDVCVIVRRDKPYCSMLECEIIKFGGKIVDMELGQQRQDFVEVFCQAEFDQSPSLLELEEALHTIPFLSDVRFEKKAVA